MGKQEETVVGYRYYAGLHMILCHGPVDYLRKIFVADELLIGDAPFVNQSIFIYEPDFFGGDAREGGISGGIDIEFGFPDQKKNSYLSSVIGDKIPSFRGVLGLVLKKIYLGNNPYLKDWSFVVQRIHTAQNGEKQWNDIIAEVSSGFSSSNTTREVFADENGVQGFSYLSKYYKIVRLPEQVGPDNELNQKNFQIKSSPYGDSILVGAGENQSSLVIARELVKEGNFIRVTAKFKLVTTGDDDCGYIAVMDRNLTKIVSFGVYRDRWVDAGRRPNISFEDYSGDTGYPVGNNSVEIGKWYNVEIRYSGAYESLVCIITDQETGELFAEQNVPVSHGKEEAKYLVIGNDNWHGAGTCEFADITVQQTTGDMNPAHIIRECLVNNDWGMGYNESDIDDESFRYSAEYLYNENFGLSLLWSNETTIEEFLQEITRHIDASLYVSRKTGKFVLKLTRNDYNLDELITLNEDNSVELTGLKKTNPAELVNSVTINYTDSDTYETATVNAQDIVKIQIQQTIIDTGIDYYGINHADLATRIAQRDLKSLSTSVWSCTVKTGIIGDQLNIGDVFLLSWEEYGFQNMVMRITGMSFGNGINNEIEISCVQDIFTLPSVPTIKPQDSIDGWKPLDQTAYPLDVRLSQEATYYQLARNIGQSTVDDELNSDANLGYLIACAGRNSYGMAINAFLYVNTVSGENYDYGKVGVLNFSPYATISKRLLKTDTEIILEKISEIEDVEAGTIAQINNELIRVDSVENGKVVIGRGVLDTVPQEHEVGSIVLFWGSGFVSYSNEQYLSGDVILVKMLTATGKQVLDIGEAPFDSVEFNSRAIRPYPPGNVKVNNTYFPNSLPPVDITITWSHRDRKQQTTDYLYDYTNENIGPEENTSYIVNIYDEQGILKKEITTTETQYIWADEIDTPIITGDLYYDNVLLSMHFNAIDLLLDSSKKNNRMEITGDSVLLDMFNYKYGDASVKFSGKTIELSGNSTVNTLNPSTSWNIAKEITIEAWIYINNIKAVQYIMHTRMQSYVSSQWSLWLFEDKLALSIWQSNGEALSIETDTPLVVNKWTHVGVTNDGNNTYTIYLDGKVILDNTVENLQYDTNASRILYIGGNTGGGLDADRGFDGNIDDLRVTAIDRYKGIDFVPPTKQNPDSPQEISTERNSKFTYEIKSIRDNFESLYSQSHTIYRNGYSYNYGMFYGGDN